VAGRRAPRAGPSSPRSQHFLRSSALAADLVACAGIRPDDVVVEIGAGTGRLTDALARVARRVLAIEPDPRLAAGLRSRWHNVDVVEGDAVHVALPREPFRVVANLPFSRTTDLLHLLLDDVRTPLLQADLIVEWAVAHKHGVPWPSSLNGVLWGSRYEVRVSRRLPRGVFTPPPSVDAGVLVFRRRSEPLVPPALAAAYHRFVATGFRHGLGAVVSSRELRELGAGRVTARDLDTHQWSTLFLRGSRTIERPPKRRRSFR
jgi:23S rRNA (adenine-N6)-dimethyltransferase